MNALTHSSRRKKHYNIIDLDEIPELKSGMPGIHAERLIVADDTIAVVEEAEKLKKKD